MSFTLFTFTFALILFVIERFFPRNKFPSVSGWYLRAILFNIVGLSTVIVYGLNFKETIIKYRIWDATQIGFFPSLLVGLLIVTFFNYWWHRIRHKYNFFWRWFHQIHHSAQRLEVVTTFYKHPIEAFADTLLTIPIVYLIAGLPPYSVSILLAILGSIELFYHWNIQTPQWLGYIIQRPESHCIHHEYKVHAYNYSDIPIWDIIFGTFKNPKKFNSKCGLGAENEMKIKEMLLGQNITQTSGTNK